MKLYALCLEQYVGPFVPHVVTALLTRNYQPPINTGPAGVRKPVQRTKPCRCEVSNGSVAMTKLASGGEEGRVGECQNDALHHSQAIQRGRVSLYEKYSVWQWRKYDFRFDLLLALASLEPATSSREAILGRYRNCHCNIASRLRLWRLRGRILRRVRRSSTPRGPPCGAEGRVSSAPPAASASLVRHAPLRAYDRTTDARAEYRITVPKIHRELRRLF
ncbi:hypothetical protein EVAR_100155_1 [Eumeta japonica]|uniref:Uncharacterized protein n=1 Tax=Eumeta variegata TaxID=151549 RepID=A0A4C1ZT72_EUMVA|nr:hypothetical protein EVAR_100155_1 [Eumeta japonica]